MFGRNLVSPRAVLNALNRSLAIIEYDVVEKSSPRTRTSAKCWVMTCQKSRGQHHSLFVEPDYAR